jgi:biopolymer transport protein ExbD/biopolymer transport protein TolR
MARHRRRHRYELNADVNVVSLIDVMLLLLVIFMITAPMMQGGVDLTLPKADAKPMESKDALSITVNRSGSIVVDNTTLTLSQFRTTVRSLAMNRSDKGVYLRADQGVNYGLIVQILAILNRAGITNVGLVTEPEEIR